MKTAIVASLIAGAAAFAPVQQKVASSTALNAFENELGAQAPLGFFDPLGLVEDGDQAKFDRLRYVEIKHGREYAVSLSSGVAALRSLMFQSAPSFHLIFH